MNYIENIYICLAVPLLAAMFCAEGKVRQMLLFLMGGMTACLLSSYISTFLAVAAEADRLMAALTIAPLVEEIMKMFPFLFYLLVFEPEKERMSGCALMTAVGFATFENVCFLIQNGASSLLILLIRGFGAGSMHIICGAILAGGTMLLWERLWLRMAGLAGLLSVAVTYHGIFNILVSRPGIPAVVGYLIPAATTFLGVVFGRRQMRKNFE